MFSSKYSKLSFNVFNIDFCNICFVHEVHCVHNNFGYILWLKTRWGCGWDPRAKRFHNLLTVIWTLQNKDFITVFLKNKKSWCTESHFVPLEKDYLPPTVLPYEEFFIYVISPLWSLSLYFLHIFFLAIFWSAWKSHGGLLLFQLRSLPSFKGDFLKSSQGVKKCNKWQVRNVKVP